MTLDLTTFTTAQLADHYNALTGKSVKPTSYTKTKFLQLILTIQAQEDADVNLAPRDQDTDVEADFSELGIYGLGHDDDTAECPHCGINHRDNGLLTADDYEVNSDLTYRETGGIGHEFHCMGCGGEWGPAITLEENFTLIEAAIFLGISGKAARARYRSVDNDGQRTFYKFPRSDWDRVISIISPKRKAR